MLPSHRGRPPPASWELGPGLLLQFRGWLPESPEDRFGQRRVHILGHMPHYCPRNPLPHCLLGTDNLYVNNNVNGHLIHRADSIHIPLQQPLPPINHHKRCSRGRPAQLLPAFITDAAPAGCQAPPRRGTVPEGKTGSSQICLWRRRAGLSCLAHHLDPKPSSARRFSSEPLSAPSASSDKQRGASWTPHVAWPETHRGPCS